MIRRNLLVLLVVLALGLITFFVVSQRFKNNENVVPEQKSLTVDQQLKDAFDKQEVRVQGILDKNTKELTSIKSKVKTPKEFENITVADQQLKIRAGIDIARDLLIAGDANLAYEYLKTIDTVDSHKNSDYMFYYYISARDSNSSNALSLRAETVKLINTQGSIEPVDKDIAESYFNAVPVKAPGGY